MKIVIIGGGYAGVELVRLLKAKKLNAKIFLVEGKDDFYASVGSSRALCNEKFAHECFIPYSGLMDGDNVTHIKKWVEDVDFEKKSIHFYSQGEGDNTMSYDYLVLATGINYNEPFRFHARTDHEVDEREALTMSVSSFRHDVFSTQELLDKLEDKNEELMECENVVVVGGGATGVETACEIKETFPEKKVTIVHSKERLLIGEPSITPAMSSKLLDKVRAAGVKVELNTRHNGEQDSTTVLINATTGKPNTAFVPESSLNEEGFVRTDEALRVQGLNNVFAMGDIVANYRKNVKVAKMQHAPVVAGNITRLVKGLDGVQEVKPLPKAVEAFTIVTLGKKNVFSVGMLAKVMAGTKTKDMFVGKQRKEMGAPKI